MQTDAKLKIFFFSDGSWVDTEYVTLGMPFNSEIDRIYAAYRQCYTPDPTKPLTPLTGEDVTKLLDQWKSYINECIVPYHPKFMSEGEIVTLTRDNVDAYMTALSGDDLQPESPYVTYLRKCRFIYQHGNHESPIEHGTLTVRITGLSRAASMQHNRHRLQSISQASQRYINEKDPSFVMPDSIRRNPEAREIFETALAQMWHNAVKLKQLDIPNEDIRALYPNAMVTEEVVTMNFRAWKHYISERACSRAQTEIRRVARRITKFLQIQVPFVFHDLGPKCKQLGYCPEHDTCGLMPPRDEALQVASSTTV